MTYYGGQNGSGHYQILINHIPKADIYVEGFMGMSGIYNHITLPTHAYFYGFDLNLDIIDYWNKNKKQEHHKIMHSDYTAVNVIKELHSKELDMFAHFDPPYRVTKSPKKYKHDFSNDMGYIDFLNYAIRLDAKVMISHPQDDLFDEYLKHWTHISFSTKTRRGSMINGIYLNYTPDELADYSFSGITFTERQRIKRKVTRTIDKIIAMSDPERNLFIRELKSKNIL